MVGVFVELVRGVMVVIKRVVGGCKFVKIDWFVGFRCLDEGLVIDFG